MELAGAGRVEIHVELASLGARATHVGFGAWMGFAPGRGRAAASDELPGRVSRWLWAGPFTFLPSFHLLWQAGPASVGRSAPCCELPEPGAGSPTAGSARIASPLSLGASCASRVQPPSCTHPCREPGACGTSAPASPEVASVLSWGAPLDLLFGTIVMGQRKVSLGSEAGTGFPATRVPCVNRYPPPPPTAHVAANQTLGNACSLLPEHFLSRVPASLVSSFLFLL